MKDYTDVLIAPVITEKSTSQRQMENVYTFKVAKKANKSQIKEAVEKAFGVHVKSINVSNTKPKDKRVGKYTGQTKTYKKAFITIAEGETIDY